MRFTPVPDDGDDIGSMGAVVGFDTPEEVSLFEQLVRQHQSVLAHRAVQAAPLPEAEEKRLADQLHMVYQWLAELSKEEEGEHDGD